MGFGRVSHNLLAVRVEQAQLPRHCDRFRTMMCDVDVNRQDGPGHVHILQDLHGGLAFGDEPKDHSSIVLAAERSRSVKGTVRTLNETDTRPGPVATVEVMELREAGTILLDPENDAVPRRTAVLRCSVEVPVEAFDETRDGENTLRSSEVMEIVKAGAVSFDSEDHAVVVRPAKTGRSVEH